MDTKRLTASLLLSAMLVCSFASCGESGDAPASNPTTEDLALESTEAEETQPQDNLPQADYGGYEFRILNNISNFAYTNIGEEGLTGETLDDTIYNRNKTVEEALNITFNIEKKEYSDTSSTIQKVVAAGEDAYDFYTCDLNILLGHAMSGCDVNALGISTLQFDQPWWNWQAINSITVGDAVYGFFGDLHTGYFESHNTLVFNKNILNDLGLSDPYAAVHENKWTLDNMISMMTAAKTDIDGDGKWSVDDRYGFTMYEGNWSLAFITGGGEFLVNKDANNLPVWNGLGERFYSVYDKVVTGVFGEKNNNAQKAKGTLPGSLELYRLMFLHGRSLFLVTQLGVLKDMRAAEFELGVVPAAKYDESQEDYYSLIFQGANAVGIPVTNPDTERTGLVLDYLAAKSTDTVRDVYINQTLDFKYIQDEESQEMLDIILSTGTFDIASVYDWGGIAGQVMNKLNAGKTDIASTIEKISSKVETAMQKTVDTFADLQ